MKNRTAIISITLLIFTTCFIPTVSASEMSKINDYIKVGMNKEAIEALQKLIVDDPTNSEAHFLLGKLYLQEGSASAAEERFTSVRKLSTSYNTKIGTIYKDASDKALATNNLDAAARYFSIASSYNPALKTEGCNFYINIGDRFMNQKSWSMAQTYYNTALANSNNDAVIKKKIGEKYLRLAFYNENGREQLLSTAKTLGIEEKRIKEVFPDPYDKIVFETPNPLTNDDAYDKEYGQIEVFDSSKYPLEKGDVIEVFSKIIGGEKFSGTEISIFRGKGFSPEWEKTQNGYFKEIADISGKSGKYIISLCKRKDIEVIVKVTRHIIPKPNISTLE